MNMLQVHIVVSYCTSGFLLSSSPYIFDLKSLRLPADSNMKFLANLPTELLLEISDFLSFVDLACLSICNHRLHAISLRQISRLLPVT
jgi:hypothetical protein